MRLDDTKSYKDGKWLRKRLFFLLTLIYLMNFCVRIFFEKYNGEAEKKNKNGPKLGTMGNVFEWTIG